MKILVISQYFWPESFRINDLVAAWTQRGHEVTVITGLPNYPAGRLFDGYSWRGPFREAYGAAPVRRVPILTRGSRRGLRLLLNYASFVLSGILLGPFLARGRYDVTFVYAPSPITICIPAIWLRWLRRIPIVFWVQDLWPDNPVALGAVKSGRTIRWLEALCRWIYRRCDLVLGQSEAFLPSIRRVCPEVARLEVLPNWADAFYAPQTIESDAPERAEWPSGFTVVFAGNLGSAQSLHTAIEAAELLRSEDVHWVFIGDGNQRGPLEDDVRRRGLGACVRFFGWRPGESMPRYLSLADVLLVSLRRDPGFASTIPAKLQSSLAMGRPIVAALEGEGARIVRESGAGVVVQQEDAAALADGVRELVRRGADVRARMGQRGRAYATSHFDRDTLVDQLDGWLAAIVEERS
jgi:glycosyltransferase involved in cell wall biosynthesis